MVLARLLAAGIAFLGTTTVTALVDTTNTDHPAVVDRYQRTNIHDLRERLTEFARARHIKDNSIDRNGLYRAPMQVLGQDDSQNEATTFEDELYREIDERAEDIERLADELYEKHRCVVGNRNGTRDEFLTNIRDSAHGAFSSKRTPKFRYELDRFRRDELRIDDQDTPSIGDHVALGRYYERCMNDTGESGDGLVELYSNIDDGILEGNCDNAIRLSENVDDPHEKYRTLTLCYPNDGRPLCHEERRNVFFEAVRDVPDKDLMASANFVAYNEQPRWLAACNNNRINNGGLYVAVEVDAYCFMDLMVAGDKTRTMNINPERVASMLRALGDDPSDQEARCYLNAYLAAVRRADNNMPVDNSDLENCLTNL